MSATLSIVNGRIIDPGSGLDRAADLHIAEGAIVAIGAPPPGFAAAQRLDAAGQLVLPGLVDLAVRLRGPGLEHQAALRSELGAAVSGGVSSVVCLPDTDPTLDEPGLVEMLKHRARQLALARVYPLGALTAKLAGERLAEMFELAQAGCIGFSQADIALADTQVAYRALQYAATFGYKVWLRPQDPFLARNGVAHDGPVATRLGLAAIPAVAETIALETILRLSRATGAQVHVCRLSAAESVDMIRKAKQAGLAVSCDISANHLHLCDTDIGDFNPMMHLMPPLRSAADRAALREGLRDGTIDAVCSDHCPVGADEKNLPFAECAPGASGVETLLALVVRWAAEEKLPLREALRTVTSAPARILGSPAGRIAPGAPADLCVVDPEGSFTPEPGRMRSRGANSPFLGRALPAAVSATLVAGAVVFPGPD
jgi:dihydroorotase